MSPLSNRATTVAATLAIFLLVVLLIVLWTNVRTASGIEGSAKGAVDDTVNKSVVRGARPVIGFEEERGNVGEIDNEIGGEISGGISGNFSNEVLPDLDDTPRTYNKSRGNILPSGKGDIEYINPMKISQNQYEDPLDEFSASKRHHSGHFRHSTAEVWDPHPQYEFTAFGRRFRLRLAHDASFVAPAIKVTHMSENSTRKEHPGRQLGCFYRGSVDGDPVSAVAVSLCHGMTGHMRTSTGSYFIKPEEHWHGNDKEHLESSVRHAIYRVPQPVPDARDFDGDNELPASRNCGLIDYDTDEAPAPLIDDSSESKIYVGGRTRERRSLEEKGSMDRSKEILTEDEEYEQFVGRRERRRDFLRNDRHYTAERKRNYLPEERSQGWEMESDPFVTWRPRRALPRGYFIEIMVVADAKMADYHGDELVSYILVLMSIVSGIYKDQSIGNPISIAVMNIVKAEEVFGTRYFGSDGIAAAEMLKRFCRWQKSHNQDTPSPDHHDTALLLTRENLCHDPGQKHCDTLGLAQLGGMCSPGASCAIVQDNGLAAAFTIAHELGHVLNMPHDDDPKKCSDYRNSSGVQNVMSRMLDKYTYPWEWSQCSRHYVTEFLESVHGNCLLDEPSKSMEWSEGGRLPGQDYSENQQCELVFGAGSRICPDKEVCRTLWCTAPMWDNPDQCHTQYMPWADGTSCGPGKWCHRGECVSRRKLKPIHGQWGEWGDYGECSRTCGGGVQKKYRLCNNPRPQYRGNYCVGERVKYRSCATQECPPGSPDFREQQCSMFDDNNRNIHNLPRDVKWHAKYTRIQTEDRCQLFCQVESSQYYSLREKVIDGTPCGPDTFDICVNGHCMPAGCDHVLDSTAELDTCGVCRGDNSTCQRITGSYNTSLEGYNRVTTIPAGSSYIDIRQYGWLGSHNDSNYLALRLGENGDYILNGNSMVMHRKVIYHSGVTIEYSGPEPIVERLNSSRPISTDLVLEVLSVGNVYPPQITFEYTVPKKILDTFTWVLSNWSDCNRMCQGMTYRRAECRSTKHKNVATDDYCRAEEKPREESQMCNAHCSLIWQVTSVSECSSHCGPGTRTVMSRCVQTLLNIEGLPPRPIPAHACHHLPRPSEHEPCVGPCGYAHWRYSEWSSCSATCGGGTQFRSATCVDAAERPVADEHCASQEPYLKKSCAHESCPKWDLGNWTECSVSCGKGTKTRAYWCRIGNRVVPHSYCTGLPAVVTETCDAGPCYQWHAGDWSPCSVTCGEGKQRRRVVCESTDGVAGDNCSLSEKPDDSIVCVQIPCSTMVTGLPITYSPNSPHDDPLQQDNEIDSNRITFQPGYKWATGPYGECSKSCNGGFMSRIVKCVSTETGTAAPDDYCDAHNRPPRTVSCNRQPCPTWNTGDWSECDAKCGHGYQHRQVGCQNHRGELLPDKHCTVDEKPRHVRGCQKTPCITSSHPNKNGADTSIVRRWRVSNWTPCSKSCGGGVKTRRVECTVKRGNHGPEVPVKDEVCLRHDLIKPRSQRLCQRMPCDYSWQEGPWSQCSADCGEGVQRRSVTCHRVNRYGWIDPTPTGGCQMRQKPTSEQICKLRECSDKFYWTAGPWRKCSHACGRKGRQIRRLFCRDVTGRKVPRLKCPVEFKPPRKRNCNQKRCGPVTCSEVQRRFKTNVDGEYPLIVGGRNMSIYCYRMDTDQPQEYLTLPVGGQGNYAEIYDKRLRNPFSCPFNGERNSSCNCVSERGTVSGRTKFERVRVNPIKLHIIADDYTFSRTTGANRVELGKAGDCYSIVKCPQGRFSINLSGTLLRISPDITWIPQSPRTSMEVDRINDQRIVGKCGGYCGYCVPNSDLKLDVLPP